MSQTATQKVTNPKVSKDLEEFVRKHLPYRKLNPIAVPCQGVQRIDFPTRIDAINFQIVLLKVGFKSELREPTDVRSKTNTCLIVDVSARYEQAPERKTFLGWLQSFPA